MTDAELVQAFREGDRAAFAVLLDGHRERAVAVARAMSGDLAMAEDAAQEAAYQAFFEIARLRQPDRFGTWLCGIAVNLTKMALRRQRFAISWDDLAGGHYVPDTTLSHAQDPQLAYEVLELQSSVQRALEVLSVDMRAAVWLHYVEGLTYQEVSAITGIPAARLRVLSYRARKRLRQELAEEWRPRVERRSKMIEVKLHDLKVMVRPEEPPNQGEPAARSFLSWVVFLKAVDDDRAVAIWVGPHEGESLAWRMADMPSPARPQTYSLMTRLVEGLGAKVERVAIVDLVRASFLAAITLQVGDRSVDFDARPSDALNLAQRTDAPIFIDEGLIARVGFTVGQDIVGSLKAHAEELQGPPDFYDLVEWRSGVEYLKTEVERRREMAERWQPDAQTRKNVREEGAE